MAAMLAIKNASFGYDDRLIWQDVNIEVAEGDCLCLLGPNGCGKTTLFNCISGMYKLNSGSIELNGRPIHSYKPQQLAQTMGVVFQEHAAPFPYSSLEVVRMGRTPHLRSFQTPSKQDTAMALSIMEELGISHLANQSYTHISGGERQLVLIARTLCQEPRIILFDEPTSHLDFKNQAMVLQTIKRLSQRGLTIVMVSHFPNHVWKLGSDAALMSYGGVVAQGAVEQVMTEDNLSRAYGVAVRIYETVQNGETVRFCDPDFNINNKNNHNNNGGLLS